jgi:hypothetical protein
LPAGHVSPAGLLQPAQGDLRPRRESGSSYVSKSGYVAYPHPPSLVRLVHK